MVPAADPSRSLTVAVLLAAKLRWVTGTAHSPRIMHFEGYGKSNGTAVSVAPEDRRGGHGRSVQSAGHATEPHRGYQSAAAGQDRRIGPAAPVFPGGAGRFRAESSKHHHHP